MNKVKWFGISGYFKIGTRTNPDVEETRDIHVEDGQNSFKMFIGFNFKLL
jgi:hypothetical protein